MTTDYTLASHLLAPTAAMPIDAPDHMTNLRRLWNSAGESEDMLLEALTLIDELQDMGYSLPMIARRALLSRATIHAWRTGRSAIQRHNLDRLWGAYLELRDEKEAGR